MSQEEKKQTAPETEAAAEKPETPAQEAPEKEAPQTEEKNAVDCGYWQLYRYNPLLAEKGENPFTLDSKDPTGDYQAFLQGEVRYASLKKTEPALAEELYKETEEASKERLANYKKMAGK